MKPDFVVIGHVVRDMVPGGWRLGGSAAFAAVQARELGRAAGLVTSVGPDVVVEHELPEIAVAVTPSSKTTTFENEYEGARRRQRVSALAKDIQMDVMPEEWRGADVMLLGPVLGELSATAGRQLQARLIGVSAQGWLRRLDDEGYVVRDEWAGAAFWKRCAALFVSEEDLVDRAAQVERWIEDVPVVAVTKARGGADVHSEGSWRSIEGLPVEEVDPTGAGDVFAAAYMVRYSETGSVSEAVRFANTAAGCSVEGVGLQGLSDREEIETRMAKHPEMVLR